MHEFTGRKVGEALTIPIFPHSYLELKNVALTLQENFVSHQLIKENSIEHRLYQEILVSRILDKGNSLVVAPTALGKTVVAAMLTALILEKKSDKKILFLSPTKPLAVQHENSMKQFLKIDETKIVSLTGTQSPKERKEIWENSTIISATPQTIENDIITGNISTGGVALVIFDECHRAVGDYSYVFIAKQLMKASSPLILGLTASPGSDQETIQDVCKNLFISNIEVKTHQDSDVKPYVNEVEVEWRKLKLPEEFMQVKHQLNEFVKDQILFLKQLGYARNIQPSYYRRKDILLLQGELRHDLGRYGSTKPQLYQGISRAAALMKIAHAITLLETQGIQAVTDYFDKMVAKANDSGASKADKMIVADERIKKALAVSFELKEKKIEHPKMKELKKILLDQFHQNPNSRVIVFNHYRDSVNAVVDYLKDCTEIKAKKFVGQATKQKDVGMKQKEQIHVIQQFREGTYNVLVASSVAEEGLDIPEVDLVVFYEPVPSEIRSIQRRGRTGRKSKGKVIILMALNSSDAGMYYASQAKEKKMHAALKGMQKIQTSPAFVSQTTLSTFQEKQQEKIAIFVDSREQASGVARELSMKEDVFLTVKPLDIGDFVLSQDVVVERKTVEDFLSSLIDGRLLGQLVAMSSNYKSPLVILEGDPKELFTLRNIHQNALMGMLSAIAIDYRIPILFSKDAQETSQFLYVIAKREQFGKDKDIRLRVGRKGFTLSEQQQFLVESLPSVGPTMAKTLLKHFKTIKNFVNANEKELQHVDNIGEKKARQIKKVLEHEYSEDSDDRKEKKE